MLGTSFAICHHDKTILDKMSFTQTKRLVARSEAQINVFIGQHMTTVQYYNYKFIKTGNLESFQWTLTPLIRLLRNNCTHNPFVSASNSSKNMRKTHLHSTTVVIVGE